MTDQQKPSEEPVNHWRGSDWQNEFYGDSLIDKPLLDPTKYRGRGRPRKQDYSLLGELQKKINSWYSVYLDQQALHKGGFLEIGVLSFHLPRLDLSPESKGVSEVFTFLTKTVIKI